MTVASSLRRNYQPQITVKVASTIDEVMHAFAIRSAVFMADQQCPYAEEFDGNDFSASHMVAYVDDEPAATIRMRYFPDFAKIERMAVRKEYRGFATVNSLIRFTLKLCQKRGYTLVLGHAQKRLVKFWSRYGFEPQGDLFYFSDHEYVTIVGKLDPDDDRLTRETDPMVLIRPEGQWDRPGILERSTERPPTNLLGAN